MSDDFDKDDIPWLQGDDDDSEEGAVTPPPGGHLGFTGELPWMQDDEDDDSGAADDDDLGWLQSTDLEADDESGDEDFDLDWLRDPTESVTGELNEPSSRRKAEREVPSWLQSEADEAAEGPDEGDVPDWLRGEPAAQDVSVTEPEPIEDDDDLAMDAGPDWLDESAAEADAGDVDVPDWLRGEPVAQADTQDDDDIDIDAGPDWLNEPAQAEPDLLDEVPDWLAGAGEPPAEPATMLDDTGGLSEAWLASGNSLAESGSSDKTFDEWMTEQAEAERVPDLEEQMPDLGTLATDDLPGATGSGELPDWYLGMDEIDTSDAPEWFTGETPATDSLSESPLGDWLQEQQPAVEEPPAAATPEPEALDSLLGAVPDEMGEDFFADLGAASSVDDDFLAMFGEEPAGEAAASQPVSDDLGEDFFADLGAAGSLDDDFLAEFGEEPAGEAAASQPVSDEMGEDFFADLGAAGSLDDDFLAEFGGEPAGETAASQPAPDDLGEDFFADLGAAGSLDDDFLAEFDTEPDEDPEMADLAGEMGEDFFADLAPGEMTPTSADIDSLDTMFGTEDDGPVDPLSVPDGQFLQSLGIEDPDDDAFDWFNLDEGREPEPEPDAMGWLDDLGEIDESALAEADDAEAIEPLPAVDAPGLDDIDSLLASMGETSAVLPETGPLDADSVDLDALFSDPAFSEIETSAEVDEAALDDMLRPETPDWLSEAGAAIGGASAASILRQQRDRPVDELSDRLKRLRERGSSVGPGDEAALAGVVPDVGDALEQTATDVGLTDAVSLSADQERRVDLLKSLTANEQANALAAARAATAEPFLLAEDETLPDVEAEAARPRTRRRVRLKVDRLVIALVLAAGVIAPFFVDSLHIGDPPPSQFAAGSRAQAVFDSLDTLQPGDYVLVGMEYGPPAAAELDSTTNILLRHILARRALPVIVSQNPVALARAEHILDGIGQADSPFLGAIGRDTPLQANEDYTIARYLSGDALGVRALGENIGPLLATDLHGEPTGLPTTSLGDFARVVVIAERPADLQAWAEQIAPLTNAPLLAAVGYAGEPLAAPFVGSAFDGLLAGYGSTLTYAAQLGKIDVVDTRPALVIPTVAGPEVSPIEEPGFPATISADQNVNVRSGPGAGFPIVTTAAPGDEIAMLGRNDIGTWLNIRTADGEEGWIATQFVDMGEVDLAELAVTEATPTAAPTETVLPTATPLATDTPAPTETPGPTSTAGPTSTGAPTETPVPTDTPTATATETATATATEPPTSVPSPTPATDVIARITANDSVNIRSGPGTQFAPVGAARPGEEFPVLGRNADGSWIQIDYPDLTAGQEAWIAEFLVEITARDAEVDEPESTGGLVVVMAGSDFSRLLAQDPTAEATEEATPEVAVGDPADLVAGAIPASEERWYAMNLGLVVIIVVIVLGAVVNIVRAVLRRGD